MARTSNGLTVVAKSRKDSLASTDVQYGAVGKEKKERSCLTNCTSEKERLYRSLMISRLMGTIPLNSTEMRTVTTQ